eukprot:9251081-Karenia_brevis.AAC.1
MLDANARHHYLNGGANVGEDASIQNNGERFARSAAESGLKYYTCEHQFTWMSNVGTTHCIDYVGVP